MTEIRVQLPSGVTMEQAQEMLGPHGFTVQYADSRPATWRHIERVGQYMDAFIIEFMRRRRVHDQSKLASPEVSAFDEATPRLAGLTFASPEYEVERKRLGEALTHHYANNSHHPDYYPNGIRGMNLLDIMEIFCDSKAASERHHDGNIRQSIIKMQEKHGFGDELKQILINTFPIFDKVDPPMAAMAP